MGLFDAVNAEDRVQVKYSEFYAIVKEAAKCELLMNAVKAHVPCEFIEAMLDDEEPDNDK